jgi:outer membrane protein assembly factor BamE
MKSGRIATVFLLVSVIGACSWVPRPIREYKIDIQQGNVLTQDMVSQLRPGLTKDQVRFILGTPVLMDMFHSNRWDYFYSLRKGSTEEFESRKFAVFFDDEDRLARVEGDVSPREAAEAPAGPENRIREIDLGSIGEDAKAPLPEKQGLFSRIWGKLGF